MSDIPYEEMMQVLREKAEMHREAAERWTGKLRHVRTEPMRRDCKRWITEDEHLAAAIEQAITLLESSHANQAAPLGAVREAVVDTLRAVDDRENDWPRPAREAAHTAMEMFLRRLGDGAKSE